MGLCVDIFIYIQINICNLYVQESAIACSLIYASDTVLCWKHCVAGRM